MRRYEGLYILNTAGKEENIDGMIDKISSDISSGGGRVESVEKMEKRQFARVADKRYQSGYYVNVIFEAEPSLLEKLRDKYALDDDVFRVMYIRARASAPATAKT